MSAEKRAEYALVVQKAARDAIIQVKERASLDSSVWATPLAAAPSAVSTMAILLKTASNSAAANLKITIREVTDEQHQVIGMLKHDTLHGNLQACTDIGRFAFQEARATMKTINNTASRIIVDGGSVEYILELLEDPEDAATNLKPAMKRMEESSLQCKEDIEKLTKQFDYWYWVICSLKKNTLDSRGKVQDQANKNEVSQANAEKDKIKHGGQEEAMRVYIEQLEEQLLEAETSVKKAEAEVERLAQLPPIPEPPFHEELKRAQEAIIAYEPEVGIGKRIKKFVSGDSKADIQAREARVKELRLQHDEYMAKAKAQREDDRKIARDALQRARDHEIKLKKLKADAAGELNKNMDQLAKAKANLAKTESTLKRLGAKKMELEDTLEILEESSRQLGELKGHVVDLVKFFKNILSDVRTAVDEDIEDFLNPIKNSISTFNGTDIISKINLREKSRKRIVTKALHIQSSFSAIMDVTGTYVFISDRYIQPAINKMEKLSLLKDEEWTEESEQFAVWCNQAVEEIQTKADDAATKMGPNMEERVNHLHESALAAVCAH